MKILFTRFPLESSYGGAEVQTISLMKGLQARGHDVSFLGSCRVLSAHCRTEKIPATYVDIGNPPVTKEDALGFFWRRKKVRATLLKALDSIGRVDAVFMLSLSEKLLITEDLAAQNTRVVWIEHDRVGRWLRWNPWLPRLRKLSQQAITVGVSELSRKVYLELGWPPERTIAIPNGIDITRLGGTKSKRRTEKDALHLGCIARLSPEKGVDLLIQAIQGLPKVTLDIVGEGPEEARLQMMIQQLETQERHETEFGVYADAANVRLLPRVDTLADFYTVHDAIVLPSRDHDPFGLVAAEAMLMGTPVIVTDACGIASYLTDGKDAVIVKANSVIALREGISRLTDVKVREEIGQEGKKTASELFTVNRMIDNYEKMILGSN